MELKMEYEGTHATFIDLDIFIVENSFVYKLYDKHNNFKGT